MDLARQLVREFFFVKRTEYIKTLLGDPTEGRVLQIP